MLQKTRSRESMSLEGRNIFLNHKKYSFLLFQKRWILRQWHKFNQWTGSAVLWGSTFQSKRITPLTVVLHKKTDVARCLFWVKPAEELEALSASVVPTWLFLVNESLSFIKLVSSFRGFDLSELYTELLCNSPYISVFTICSPFLNADMCYCLSSMCHQFTTTNSVKWKSGQGEIYFRHFCSTSFYSSPHANHMNSEQGSKKPNKIMFWLLTDIFNGLFHSPFGKPHPVLGFTGKHSCWKF